MITGVSPGMLDGLCSCFLALLEDKLLRVFGSPFSCKCLSGFFIFLDALFSDGMCLLFYFWLHHTTCGILIPQPGIKPVSPALEAQSPNHWTAKEVPQWILISCSYKDGERPYTIFAHPFILNANPFSNIYSI